MYNILICDDEKDIVSAIEIYLKTAGYSVYKAYNGMEAVDMVNSNDIQLVLMDVMMPQTRCMTISCAPFATSTCPRRDSATSTLKAHSTTESATGWSTCRT